MICLYKILVYKAPIFFSQCIFERAINIYLQKTTWLRSDISPHLLEKHQPEQESPRSIRRGISDPPSKGGLNAGDGAELLFFIFHDVLHGWV